MNIEEAVIKFVKQVKKYQLIEHFTPDGMENVQCLGVCLKSEDSYMDFFMALTHFFDENEVDDPEFLLEGASVEETERGTVVFFPLITQELKK